MARDDVGFLYSLAATLSPLPLRTTSLSTLEKVSVGCQRSSSSLVLIQHVVEPTDLHWTLCPCNPTAQLPYVAIPHQLTLLEAYTTNGAPNFGFQPPPPYLDRGHSINYVPELNWFQVYERVNILTDFNSFSFADFDSFSIALIPWFKDSFKVLKN
jgi:hypothetical protein